jgi:hypothetical protein
MRVNELRDNLLNGDAQFLNTLSELALARWYGDNGWSVSFFVPLPDGKNVDIRVEKDAEERYIEVLNSQIDEADIQGFFSMAEAGKDIDFRLRDKITRKYGDKFEKTVNDGWRGTPWIALDFAKNDRLLLVVYSNDHLAKSAGRIFNAIPNIAGVVYYASYGDSPRPDLVREFRNPNRGRHVP